MFETLHIQEHLKNLRLKKAAIINKTDDFLKDIPMPDIKELYKKYTDSPSLLLNNLWKKLHGIPGGKQIFSTIIGQYIPYTGSISPLVTDLGAHHAIVSLKDCRKVRNHLGCVHAIALANLGEFTTGLCLISQLDESAKGILVNLNITFAKKARGELLSEAHFVLPEHDVSSANGDVQYIVDAFIKDAKNETVCKVSATWQVRR